MDVRAAPPKRTMGALELPRVEEAETFHITGLSSRKPWRSWALWRYWSRGMDDSSFISGLGDGTGLWRHIYTHTHTYTQIHTHIHIPYLWKPHHLSDFQQSWQTFLPPTTISIPTVGSRGPHNLLLGEKEPTLDFMCLLAKAKKTFKLMASLLNQLNQEQGSD